MELSHFERRALGEAGADKAAEKNARTIGRAAAESLIQERGVPATDKKAGEGLVADVQTECMQIVQQILEAPADGQTMGPLLSRRAPQEIGRTLDMGKHYLTLVSDGKFPPALYAGAHSHLRNGYDGRVNMLYTNAHYGGVLPYHALGGYGIYLVQAGDVKDTLQRLAAHCHVEAD